MRDADPEWLIVAPCGFDLERTLREVPMLEALPGWSDLRRVREGKVAWADGNKYFNRSGTTIVETVEILAEILHGYPAGHRGKAWVSNAESRQSVLIRELHEHACAGLAHVSRSAHGIRRLHGRLLEARGYCCGSGCRHCPYPAAAQAGANAG